MKTLLTTMLLGAILAFGNTFSGGALARGGGGHVGGGHTFGGEHHGDQNWNRNEGNRNWNNNYYGGYGSSFGVYGGSNCYTDQNGLTTCN